VRVEPIRLSCFAPEIWGWAKHISGKWRGSLNELNAADGTEYQFPSDRQPVRSSTGGKYRSCRLVLRLPFPTRADNHQHYWSYYETAGM